MKSTAPAEPYIDYRTVKKLPKNFAKLASEYRDLADHIKATETRKKEIGALLCGAMLSLKLTRIEVDNLWVRQQENVNTRIDAKLLLGVGVPADTIQKATVTTRTPYALVQTKPEGVNSPLVEN